MQSRVFFVSSRFLSSSTGAVYFPLERLDGWKPVLGGNYSELE